MGNYAFPKSFLGAVNKPPRNGFDLSRKECYSMPFGTILPIGFERVQPDEHYKGSLKSYVQTNNMRDDNFCEIHNHMKAVFVPMSSLKRNYLQFTPFADSSRLRKDLSVSQKYYQPCIKNNEFHKLFLSWFIIADLFKSAINLTSDLFDYKFYYDSNTTLHIITPSGTELVGQQAIADWNPYACALTCLFPVSYSVDSTTAKPYYLYLYNTLDTLRSRSGQFFVYDALRLADALGYGNFWPIYSDIVNKIAADFVKDASVAMSIFSSAYLRPADYVQTSTFITVICKNDSFTTFCSYYCDLFTTYDVNWSLEPLVAYQYYIDMCEKTNYRKPSTFVFTLDWFAKAVAASGITSTILSNYSTDVIRVNNGTLTGSTTSSDIFASLNVANNLENYVQEESLTGSYYSIIFYLFGLSNPLLSADLYTSSQLTKISGLNPSETTITVEKLNSVNAIYKARQALLRAGVRASNYMKSVFGIEGDDHITEPVIILDDTRNNVTITGLINQAATSEAELGERASKGNGGAGLNFSLQSKDFGFIFYVQYMTCEVFYENFMRDRAVTTTPNNEISPFDANLGLSPIYGTDILTYQRGGIDGTVWKDTSDTSVVVGYTSRNFDYKTKVNKVHGFFTNNPMIYTSTNYSNISSIQKLPSLSRGNAPRGGFVVTVYDQQQNKFANTGDLYYSFDMLNGIFNQMNDGLLFGSAMFDQFSVITAFNVHKVSPMAVLGLPKLI